MTEKKIAILCLQVPEIEGDNGIIWIEALSARQGRDERHSDNSESLSASLVPY